jgi:hypothetical protein
LATTPPISGSNPASTALQPVRAGPATQARAAAQKAFFDAALGRTPAAAPAVVPARTQAPAPAAVRVQVQPNAEPPSRILRPGSLLDIKV